MTKNKSKTCGKPEIYGKSGDLLHERVIAVAGYIVENNATVRQTAKEFGIKIGRASCRERVSAWV